MIDQSFHYLHDGQLLQLTQNEPCREQDFEVLLSGTGKFAHNVVKVLKCTNERLPFKYVVLARCGGERHVIAAYEVRTKAQGFDRGEVVIDNSFVTPCDDGSLRLCRRYYY